MKEKNFGDRNDRGNYVPKKSVGYPPVFVWPLAPIKALKWVFSIPGYFLPWNLFYVGIGLVSWFVFRKRVTSIMSSLSISMYS